MKYSNTNYVRLIHERMFKAFFLSNHSQIS